MNADIATPSKGLKVAMIIARTLMGLLFLFASITYLFKLITPPPSIVLVHAFLGPEGLPVALFLVFANGLVAYYHRDWFKPLFQP